MPSFILDFLLNETTLSPEMQGFSSEIFVVFKADGINSQVASQRLPAKPHMEWKVPARMILTVSDLSKSYLYVSINAVDTENQKINCIGIAKVGLRALPVGHPRSFQFPLLAPKNTAIQTCTLHLTATISTFFPFSSANPTYSQISVPNPCFYNSK